MITSMTRFSGGTRADYIAAAKKAKPIFEKVGGQFEAAQVYTGPHTGQWVAIIRFRDWEAYGNAMTRLGGDPEYQSMMAELGKFTTGADRTILMGVDF